MLTLFPSLLSWSQLSPFLIRLVLAGIFIFWSVARLRATGTGAGSKLIALLDLALGALFLVGLWTQLAAAIVVIDMLWRIVKKATEKAFLTAGVNYYLIILVLAVSLLVTGAGWYAIDFAF